MDGCHDMTVRRVGEGRGGSTRSMNGKREMKTERRRFGRLRCGREK